MKHIIHWMLILCIALVTTTNLQAQKSSNKPFTVKGELVDSITKEGEPYATIRIFTPSNQKKAVYAAVTQTNGKFNETLKEAGKYIIHFSSVGKNTVIRTFSVSDEHPIANLGTLLISESAEMLKGVEIVAQKPLVTAEIDKVTYSIEDDPDSKTNTTLEMLRKVPLVTIDGEDNIKVNGSSSFKVHVNGKPNSLMSNNPKDVLKSLPANSVKSIEVITEPGAKYDADGIGGILNIITVSRTLEGYTVSLNAGANNRGYNASGYGTVKLGKFTVTGNYSFSHNESPASYNDSEREDFTSEEFKYLLQNSRYKGESNFQYGSMEGSYEIDTLNLITFSMYLMGSGNESNGLGSTRMLNAQREHAYSYNLLSRSNSDWKHVNATLDYQRSFKKKGEYFTFSYRYGTSPNERESHTDYEDIKDYPYDTSFLYNQFYNSDARTDEHIFQLDYTNPINKKHSIDFGGKYILRNNQNESMYMKQNTSGDYYEENRPESDYQQTHNILAAYFDYMVKTKKLSGKMGVRYEHTFEDVKYANMPEGNYSAEFDNLVPSLRLGYQLAPSKMLSVSYQMRIARPDINLLNPFRNTSNPTSVSYGNPDLDPAKSHRLGITLNSFSAKFSTNINFNYRFVNNSIQGYTFMKDGIQHHTYDNIGSSQVTSLSLWMNWNPGNKTRISVNASGDYNDYKSKSNQLDAKNHGFSGNLGLNFQQTLPWELRFSVNGGCSSPYISLQGKGSSYSYYGFSLNRSFLKNKRLTVSLHTSNIFQKYRISESKTLTSTFFSRNKSKYQQSYYGLNVSWRFGELRASVKKTAKTISGEDIMATGSK
jgi:outer membrane receptor protein involved in Fe transport